MEDKNLLMMYLNTTMAHLTSDVESVEDYNSSFWKQEELKKTDRLSTTALLLGDLLDNLKKVM
ncbi:hypothetical protein [Leuconostoc mesenteroides]|jgi:hypothetical protein|uniref:hypothetical protein n=1 Tax=Leuconostoc mesenteroides TaxID=1245 RepID=UPI001B8DA5E1|nr:hypothetical protein [Leuconostoc mesenteroides]MBS0941675.1 hypothetical protein [Leuconostoc mesenteroides]MCJ2158927.1 hypothetical protein [Leuconostoc mesenteroides]MCM6835648.1 hypothetical protein [Leuconostoc mesenteroides]